MLKEWQRDFGFIPEPDLIDPEERIPLSINVFGRLCLLLTKLFPNEKIKNAIVDFLEKFEGKRLLLYFDYLCSAQLRLVKGIGGPGMALPIDFPEQVRTDYLSEMQKIVRLASLARDNYLDRTYDDRPILELRATALESEFLCTFSKQAQQENQEIKFSLPQKEIMRRFSKGVMDLPVSLRGDFFNRTSWNFYKENRQN